VNGKYEVKLDLFEGPLDLLLYLVNKAEVDITQIAVAAITDQYLQYLDMMRDLNIDVASEYLHMAATLIRIKARELLPEPQPGEIIPEEEGIYNREQLIAQLLEYKKYKEAAFSLRGFEAHQAGSYGRGQAEEITPSADGTDEVYLGNLTIYDLLDAFRRVLVQAKPDEPGHVVKLDYVNIDDRIEHVLTVIADAGGEMPFEQLFADNPRRMVVVVTFMALLELIKMQEIQFRQERQFGSIFVSKRDPSTRENLSEPQEAVESPDEKTDNPEKEKTEQE
jgi:segregation and condensation protein A